MSTSPELLRGEDAVDVGRARLDSDLRSSPYGARSPLSRFGVDPRLVDSRLEPAFDELMHDAQAAARAEGFAAGLAEGRAAAAAELEQHRRALEAEQDRMVVEDRRLLGRALDAVDEAVTEWEHRTLPAVHELEASAVALAVDIVTELAGHLPELARHAVERALALTVGMPGEVVLRLHPDDAARVTPAAAGRSVVVVPDPSIAPGGCLAEAGGRRVDARLDTTLARLRTALAEGRS